jgi:hypothetical protein
VHRAAARSVEVVVMPVRDVIRTVDVVDEADEIPSATSRS